MRQIVLLSVLLLIALTGCQRQPAGQPVTSAPAIPQRSAPMVSATTPSPPQVDGVIPKIQLFHAFVAGEQHFQLFKSINVQRPVFNGDGKFEYVVIEEKLVPTRISIAGVRALNLDGSERDLQQTLKDLASQEPMLVIQPRQTIHPAVQKIFPATMVVLEIPSTTVSP